MYVNVIQYRENSDSMDAVLQYYSNMRPNVAEVADELQKEQWLGESGTIHLCPW